MYKKIKSKKDKVLNNNNSEVIDQIRPTLVERVRIFFSDQTLTKKATLNALAAGLDYAARLLVGFFITPALVSGLGNYYYGVFQVLTRLMGYLSPASGRPTQALKMILANQQFSASDERKRQYVGSTLIVWLWFLPLSSVLGGLITWFVPFWIKAASGTYAMIRIASLILMANMIFSILEDVPHSTLDGENQGYKRMGMSAFLVFLGGGFTWIALFLKTGIIGVAAAALLIGFITGLFFLKVVRNTSPWFGVSRPETGETKKFLGLSVWFMVWNLVMTLMTASDVVVLGIFQSVQAVTDYTLTKYAPETTISVIAIVVFSILPGLGGIIGSKDFVKAAGVRSEIMSFTWWVLTVFGTTILVWNQIFLKLWVGFSHYTGALSNLLIILMVCQFVLLRNDANVIDLTLNLPRKVILGVVSVSLSILLAIIFVGPLKMGITGLCIGVMLGRLVLSIAYPLIVGRLLSLKIRTQLISIMRPGLIILAFFSTASIISEKINNWQSTFTGNWIGLVFAVVITVVVTAFFSYLFGFNHNQKLSVNQRLKSMIFSGNDKSSKE
jgi:hypothetical protein